MDVQTGDAAGVPYLVEPPAGGRPDAPVVVGWHMMDPPRSETAFHAALPLSGLDAWKVYIGLPLAGSRLPGGSLEEFAAIGMRDPVRLGHDPVNRQGADEFAPTWAALRERFGFGSGPLGLLGGSAGGAVALEVLARGGHDVASVLLVNPMVALRPAVGMIERRLGTVYPWDDETEAIARRIDYVARADELGTAPIHVVLGADDDEAAIQDPVRTFVERYPGPASTVTVDGMAHALADEPGLDPAPQTAHAAVVDGHAVAWFRRTLAG